MALITFIIGRIKSVKFALKGMFLLLKTEHAIITQFSIGILLIVVGFYLEISRLDWIIQFAVIGFVLAIEGLNTAIEKVCDFVHINFDKRIGFIKDISAGAVSFAVFFSLIILILMYYPYLFEN
ncbi:MAG: diacylglycerol kinase [Flavobacteriaceae bacterium]